ncbi:MAG: hypothetical protein ACLT0Y_09190 [Christensenellales bacterium]
MSPETIDERMEHFFRLMCLALWSATESCAEVLFKYAQSTACLFCSEQGTSKIRTLS